MVAVTSSRRCIPVLCCSVFSCASTEAPAAASAVPDVPAVPDAASAVTVVPAVPAVPDVPAVPEVPQQAGEQLQDINASVSQAAAGELGECTAAGGA